MSKNTNNIDVFDKWQVYPCAECESYRPLDKLIQYGSVIVCLKCKNRLDNQKKQRDQKSLFDDQSDLF